MKASKRVDYTFKYNNFGRHNWLRLTPAYSIKLVQELLPNVDHPLEVLDPFCGTATTGMVSAEHGLNCTLFDINPFLVWFCTIKTSNFSSNIIDEILDQVERELSELRIKDNCWIPPMHKIERWWDNDTLLSLSTLRDYISTSFGEPSLSGEYNLLWVSFAKLIIDTSSADYNHISVSFKSSTTKCELDVVKEQFLRILKEIAESAKVDLRGKVTIVEGDSRYMSVDQKYDIVITSPPYPNRISYIRELRPYMYWLRFLESGKQAGEIDWKAIGGTWGSATSKLSSWERVNQELCPELLQVCDKISESDQKNGRTMALYVLKFFDDMFMHFANLKPKLNKGAKINYILGNSSFYNHMVDTEFYIKDMLQKLGYTNISSKIIRKRNSKNGLYEYLISADN